MKQLICLLLACLPLCLYSQIIIKGTVWEEKGLSMIGATVVVKGDEGRGTVTEFDGTFYLEVDSLPVTLKVYYMGYGTKVVEVFDANKKLDIYMNYLFCYEREWGCILYSYPRPYENRFRHDMLSLAEPLYGLGLNGLLGVYENRGLNLSLSQRGVGTQVGMPLEFEIPPSNQLPLLRPDWGGSNQIFTDITTSTPLAGEEVENALIFPNRIETWDYEREQINDCDYSHFRMEAGSYGTAGGVAHSYVSHPNLSITYNYLHSEGHRPNSRSDRQSINLYKRSQYFDYQLFYSRKRIQDPGPLSLTDFVENPASANPYWEENNARQTDDIALFSIGYSKRANRTRLTLNYGHRDRQSPYWGDNLHDAGILLENHFVSRKKRWMPDLGGKIYYGNTFNFVDESFFPIPEDEGLRFQAQRLYYNHYLRYQVGHSDMSATFSLLGMGEGWEFDNNFYFITGKKGINYDLYPKINLKYDPRFKNNMDWIILLDLSKGQHFPRHVNMMYIFGESSKLLPEKSWTYNLIAGFSTTNELTFNANGYYMHGKNPIVETLGSLNDSRWVNGEKVWRGGLELSFRGLDIFSINGLQMDLGYHLNKGRILGFNDDLPVVGFPTHKFLSKMKYGFLDGDKLSFSFSYMYLSPFTSKYFMNGDLPARHLLNARVNWGLNIPDFRKNLLIFVGANNLLNRRYAEGIEGLGHGPLTINHEQYIYPGGGVYIYGGVDFSLNYDLRNR